MLTLSGFPRCPTVRDRSAAGTDAADVQVGCRIHFDCTPKDAANDPTQAHNPPTWTFNGPVSAGNVHDFTPTVTAQSPGNLTAYVTIDGVTSNTLNVSIHN